jgi:eukaryotic-like serine/threonine-protein kinase
MASFGTWHHIPFMSETLAPADHLFLSFQAAIVGRYSLERELGRGGMGVVYLAREVRLDRPVAIKLLPPELAAQERLRDRFLREARTAARLSHPYIVPIHAVDEIGEFVFYVMAYVDGETLAQRVASRGTLTPSDATRIMREVAWALAYAHAQGVVHRDVKPANILLERGTERSMVADFGIARQTHTAGETMVGELLGTPEYMSPEQASGEAVDGRSDLYSLGLVGFFALTGQPPFAGSSAQSVLAQQITKPAPPVASVAVGIPSTLARAIDQCLEKDPSRRPATGEALADALVPPRETSSEVPVPIRVFLDRRRMAGMIPPAAALIPMGIGLLIESLRGGGALDKAIVGGALVAAGLSLPIVILLMRLRSVLKRGYRTDDIAVALRTMHVRQREEFLYEFGQKKSLRERLVRVASIGLFVGAGAAVVTMIAGGPKDSLVPLTFFAAYAGVIASAFSARWRRLRNSTGSFWARMWQGKFGRLLARATRVKPNERAISTNRPTELAIAMSAESLYASFSKEMRESLGDVPGVLRTLEAHAQAARARIDEVDATIAQAQHPGRVGASEARQMELIADLRAERTKADDRLAEVVTALENVRLDLLRLHAGTRTPQGITQDLEAARALGEDADRLIAGVREAEATLKR